MTSKRFLSAALVAVNIFIFGFLLWRIEPMMFSNVFLLGRGVSCSAPIYYSISSFDNSFGISRDDFLKALRDAERLWENATHKNLFEYKNNGLLAINLVFDQRQQGTIEMEKILGTINQDRDGYQRLENLYNAEYDKMRSLESRYTRDLKTYKLQEAELNASFDQYALKQNEYNQGVINFNAKKNRLPEEYDALRAEGEKLKDSYAELKARDIELQQIFKLLDKERQNLNDAIGRVNTLAGILTRLAGNINLNAAQYNQIHGAEGEFEKGLYTQNGSTRKIDIYQFYDNKDLALTIAHEFGHALGIEHASSSDSVMYSSMNGQQSGLSKEDLALFNKLCR